VGRRNSRGRSKYVCWYCLLAAYARAVWVSNHVLLGLLPCYVSFIAIPRPSFVPAPIPFCMLIQPLKVPSLAH